MSEIYLKRGRVTRYENGMLVRVAESGEARETGEAFFCAPVEERAIPKTDGSDAAGEQVRDVVRRIESVVAHPLSIERLIVAHGTADHQFGGEHWSEETRRVHLSIAFRNTRIVFDLADYDLSDVVRAVDALPRIREERESPLRIRLAPCVTAALLPALVGVAPPNVTLWQMAGGRDGKGRAIEELRIESPPWPNWYRPTYRQRPVRAPHNLRMECSVTEIDDRIPTAVALLAPVSGLMLRVLCVDGSVVYPSTVRVARIDAAGPPLKWYPYAAGAWGAEVVF
jgi:hypothetical protein